MLNKKYIKSNIFLYIALILIIKKLNEDLRIYIDYQALNALTVKNKNALFFIREIMTRLYIIKIFIKFNIIAAFNKIRIKKENKKKIVFLTRYKLFKYVIILFKLYNALNTF